MSYFFQVFCGPSSSTQLPPATKDLEDIDQLSTVINWTELF